MCHSKPGANSTFGVFQVILSDADFSKPSTFAQAAARFTSLLDNASEAVPEAPPVPPASSPAPVKRDIFDTSDLELPKPKPDAEQPTPMETEEVKKSRFELLMDQQASTFEEIKTVRRREDVGFNSKLDLMFYTFSCFPLADYLPADSTRLAQYRTPSASNSDRIVWSVVALSMASSPLGPKIIRPPTHPH